MERIIIKNFGGIDELDIELKPINIFIGKQASGKSVTVKLVYFFKSIVGWILGDVRNGLGEEAIKKKIRERFEQRFPRDYWFQSSFYLKYVLDEEYIEITHSGTIDPHSFIEIFHLDFRYSQGIQRQFENAKLMRIYSIATLPAMNEILEQNARISMLFFEKMRQDLNIIAGYSTTFVPAGRSFFANIQQNIFSFVSENPTADPFLIDFGAQYEQAKQYSHTLYPWNVRSDDAFLMSFTRKAQDILVGTYLQQDQKDSIIQKNQRTVNILHAASGQQETLPLLILLRALPNLRYIGATGFAIVVEEPEGHIFPSTQREIVELMSLLFNYSQLPVQYFITTHSPYILTSFNNLLYAGVLEANEQVNKEELYKIIPQEQILKRGTVAAFEMSGGTAKNIVSEETGMIFAEYLDQVSEETSIQFDKLLDLLP